MTRSGRGRAKAGEVFVRPLADGAAYSRLGLEPAGWGDDVGIVAGAPAGGFEALDSALELEEGVAVGVVEGHAGRFDDRVRRRRIYGGFIVFGRQWAGSFEEEDARDFHDAVLDVGYRPSQGRVESGHGYAVRGLPQSR
jgi:hypothetical protein